MRLAALTLLLLLLSGCPRWVGITGARREVIQDGLLAQRFPLPAEEATRRLHIRSMNTRCDQLANGEVQCGGCTNGRCIQLIEEQGLTRIATRDELTEAELLAMWQQLDVQSLTWMRQELDDRVADKLIEQELRFEPRWGITGGVLAGVSTDASAVGIGGRLGVRRWFDVHLLGHVAVEYRYKGDHELSLRVGFEIARWTDGRVWGAPGAPPASVSFFIGPRVRVPALRGGLRTGVGFHLTDIRMVPFFAEFAAETNFAGESSNVAFVFTLGIGL